MINDKSISQNYRALLRSDAECASLSLEPGKSVGVAAALREERRQVALIDPDPEAINESQSLDCLLVTGDALSRDSLLRAGINDAEIMVLCTNNDEVNLLGCAFAREYTVSRWG